MIWFESALYVRIVELVDGPKPLPLKSGFSAERAYRVIGLFNASESSDAFFVLTNDRQEMWFICNRHLRPLGIFAEKTALNLPLKELTRESTYA